MNTRQITFLAINIIGGILVIGSYIWSIWANGSADPFWGGVPVSLRNIFAASMLVAAVSYLVTIFVILLRLDTVGTRIFNTLDYRIFSVLFGLICSRQHSGCR